MAGSRTYRPLAQVRAVGGPYVDQVVADFRALPLEAAQLPRYGEAAALADSSDTLDWQQLFTLELWVVQLMPLYQLEQRAGILGQLFHQTAAALPDPAQEDYEPRLRAWALNLQSERQWAFRKNLLREQEAWRLRRRLAATLWAVTAIAVLVSWSGMLFGWQGLALLSMVAWLGISGGYASIARRAQSPGPSQGGDASQGTALGNLCALDVGQDSVVQGMLLAGLFALVGYSLLASGLFTQLFSPALNASLIPQFKSADWPSIPLTAGGHELAKLAVWSFLFGFAERLVPDVLDRLTGKLKLSKSGK